MNHERWAPTLDHHLTSAKRRRRIRAVGHALRGDFKHMSGALAGNARGRGMVQVLGQDQHGEWTHVNKHGGQEELSQREHDARVAQRLINESKENRKAKKKSKEKGKKQIKKKSITKELYKAWRTQKAADRARRIAQEASRVDTRTIGWRRRVGVLGADRLEEKIYFDRMARAFGEPSAPETSRAPQPKEEPQKDKHVIFAEPVAMHDLDSEPLEFGHDWRSREYREPNFTRDNGQPRDDTNYEDIVDAEVVEELVFGYEGPVQSDYGLASNIIFDDGDDYDDPGSGLEL